MGKWGGYEERTASTHLNWPQNIRPSVTDTRRFLLRSELSHSVASSLSSGRKVVFGSWLIVNDVCGSEYVSCWWLRSYLGRGGFNE